MSKFSINNVFSATVAGTFVTVLTCACGVARADTGTLQVPVVIQQAASSASRAEVRADLAVWRAAGMQKYSSDDGDSQVFSAAYQKDRATYEALRSSPQFAVLVADFQRGDKVKVAVTRDPLRVSIAAR